MKNKKIIVILIISIILLILLIGNVSAAINPDDYKPPQITSGGKIATIGNKIIGGIQYLGSIISVIVLVIIGIKYIIGSTEEKAEYKETMIPYIVGAVCVFAISNILSLIAAIFSQVGDKNECKIEKSF